VQRGEGEIIETLLAKALGFSVFAIHLCPELLQDSLTEAN
jgi:hypothetical protein